MCGYQHTYLFSQPYDTSCRQAAMAAYTDLSIIKDRHNGVRDPSDKNPFHRAELIEDVIPTRTLQ